MIVQCKAASTTTTNFVFSNYYPPSRIHTQRTRAHLRKYLELIKLLSGYWRNIFGDYALAVLNRDEMPWTLHFFRGHSGRCHTHVFSVRVRLRVQGSNGHVLESIAERAEGGNPKANAGTIGMLTKTAGFPVSLNNFVG